MVRAWSIGSLQDLIGFLSKLHALGIDLMLHKQGLDTTTPSGKAMCALTRRQRLQSERNLCDTRSLFFLTRTILVSFLQQT